MRILRVDNPHTKPFPFWRWLIEEIQAEYPDVIFLAEAFTRPKVMYDLAKLGFSQSYTYFTWRNTKEQLTRYFSELAQAERAGLLPSQSLDEHAGHPRRIPAVRRSGGFPDAAGPGRQRSAPTTGSTGRPSS